MAGGEAAPGGDAPREQLLAIFDVFAEWFARPDFEGCAFLTTMIEVGDDADPIRQAAVRHLANIQSTCNGSRARQVSLTPSLSRGNGTSS